MLCGEALSPGVCPALRLFVTFAELPQASKWRKWPLRNFRKRQNGEISPCGTSASVKMEKMAFAELPQASKRRKWCLRDSRKHEKGKNGVCGTSASIQKEKVVFAELPQASKRGKWRLRNFRKHPKGESGVCGTSAKADLFSEAPVPPPLKTPALAMDIAGEWKNENGRIPEGLHPTGTRPNLLADPTYSVGMSRLTFFEPTRA